MSTSVLSGVDAMSTLSGKRQQQLPEHSYLFSEVNNQVNKQPIRKE